jgi:hypothetical protein
MDHILLESIWPSLRPLENSSRRKRADAGDRSGRYLRCVVARRDTSGRQHSRKETQPTVTYIVDPSVPIGEQKPDKLPPFRSFVVNSWSPNGEMLAGQTTITATGIATYSFRNRAYDVLTDFGEFPVWLPNNRQLLFVSRGREIVLIDRLTKMRRTLFVDPRNVIGPVQMTRDGRTLYFSRRVTESDIWTLTLN